MFGDLDDVGWCWMIILMMSLFIISFLWRIFGWWTCLDDLMMELGQWTSIVRRGSYRQHHCNIFWLIRPDDVCQMTGTSGCRLEHTYWPSSPGVFVGLLVKNTTISTEGGGAKVFSKWKRDGTAAIYTSFLHLVDCRLFSLICKERGVCWWVGCKSVCLFGGHLPKIQEILDIEFNPDCNPLWIFSSLAFWEIWPLPN